MPSRTIHNKTAVPYKLTMSKMTQIELDINQSF